MSFPERLETRRLTLRKPAREDAPMILRNYATDPEVTRHLMWRPHASLRDTHEFLDLCARDWESGSTLTWAIARRGSEDVIGMISARNGGFKFELGYVLARAVWGEGFMTEAGQAVVKMLLGREGAFRVWAVCDVENQASARVLAKLGMAEEGVLRRWTIHPNISSEPRDCRLFAKVRPD